jgi:uncharacterized protein (TIGR03067 family)
LLTGVVGVLAADADKEKAERIARLIVQLGDDSFDKRAAATKELIAIGEPARPALRKATANVDLEISRRARHVLAALEVKQLQGAWYSRSTEEGGRVQTGENRADRHIFTGDSWRLENGTKVIQCGTITVVEVGEKLVKIDFRVTEGLKKGDVWIAVYERDGDSLKWCGGYAGDGRARPTELKTRANDGYFLRSLKRETK